LPELTRDVPNHAKIPGRGKHFDDSLAQRWCVIQNSKISGLPPSLSKLTSAIYLRYRPFELHTSSEAPHLPESRGDPGRAIRSVRASSSVHPIEGVRLFPARCLFRDGLRAGSAMPVRRNRLRCYADERRWSDDRPMVDQIAEEIPHCQRRRIRLHAQPFPRDIDYHRPHPVNRRGGPM
jgi:hypothetical protein